MKRSKTFAGKLAVLGMAVALLAQPAMAATGTNPATIPATPDVRKMPETGEPGKITTEMEPVTFTDLGGSYAKRAVEELAAHHMISGKGGGQYRPQDPITRLDAASLLARVAGLQPSGQGTTRFEDVPRTGLQAAYVASLAEAGIIKGKSDTWFGASDPLTRQDIAVMLARLMQVMGEQSADEAAATLYQDEQEIADYARDAVEAVTAKKWMQGNAGRFAPARKVTRGEAAVIAERVFAERKAQSEKAAFEVDKEKLRVVAGSSERIRVTGKGGNALPFSPVFSFDQMELGRVLSDGTFVAGPNPGKGTITVSVGYNTLDIPVEITADGTPAEKDGKPAEPGSPNADGKPTEQTKLPQATDWLADVGLQNYGPDSFTSIRTTGPADTYFKGLEKSYPGPVGGLAKPSETWTGYVRQFGREVTVALPEAKNVEHVLLTFRQDRKQGIVLPEHMEVELSQDGKVWWYAGKASHSISPSDEKPMIHTMMVSIPSTKAQYVRVRFPVKVIVFARNLQVWGTDEDEGSTVPVLFAPSKQSAALEDKKAGDRIQNMLLAYSGAYAERGMWTKDDFLPFVGYISTDGKVLDQMFDSILFLPYPNLPSTKQGWENYLKDLFRPGRQLDALNEAMREYNKLRGTLYNNPTKEKVVLTLPYPSPAQSDFGEVYEDQYSFSFSAAHVGEEKAFAYRKQALEWYFTELLKRWDNAEYAYLQLEGIYWFHELVDDGAPRERELIRAASNMVHDKALRFYWIPYFGAAGLADWKKLGFDYAFLQPNFYGDKEIPVDRVETTLAVANQYGMGVEIEGDERMVRDMRFYRTYYNQLIAAHKLGIDKHKIHAYYYGSKSLLEAFHSKSPQARAVYDDTYQWMRGRFNQTEYLTPELTPSP